MLDLWSEKLLMSGGGGLAEPIRFDYTGALQTFVVPSGVKSVRVDCVGASGGSFGTSARGGKGGRVQTILSVTPKQTLFIYVGGSGSNTSTKGGYNGGGNGGSNKNSGTSNYGPGGGGASDIRTVENDLNSRLVVGGGGGGSAGYDNYNWKGGDGGGLVGQAGSDYYGNVGSTYSGKGGTQTAGGNGEYSGTFGIGASSRYVNNTTVPPGGGGGGWYGGGAAWHINIMKNGWSGSGGGSSYTDPDLCSEVVHTQGYQDGNGYVIISGV